MTESTAECTCKEHFGQLHWSPACDAHSQCPLEMRGIPIRCILVDGHRGNHK